MANYTVTPKVGMSVEHGVGGKRPLKYEVSGVDYQRFTFRMTDLGDTVGDISLSKDDSITGRYSADRPWSELVKAGEKIVWNHE